MGGESLYGVGGSEVTDRCRFGPQKGAKTAKMEQKREMGAQSTRKKRKHRWSNRHWQFVLMNE